MNKKIINSIAAGAAALALAVGPVMANQPRSSVVDRIGYSTETVMSENKDTSLALLFLLPSIVFLAVALSVSEDEPESN